MDQAILERLRHVRVSDPQVSLDAFPDFLIIGPQRTGTTWLHANLREHPEIFMSEPKELFFFSRLKTPGHPRFQSDDLCWYLSCFQDPLWRRALRQALCIKQHGRAFRPKVKGEATASYAALDHDVIEEIALLNPRLKAIMMVRNPIDRAWSHATKDLVRNQQRKLSEVSDREFEEFFSDPYQLRCAAYSANLANWRDCLGEKQVLVGKFDDVAARPEQLLVEVMNFLGVSSQQRYLGSLARSTVNPAGSREIPAKQKALLESLLATEMQDWRENFAG